MDFNLTHLAGDIVEFICVDTIRDIDLGVLDLSHVREGELREVLLFFGEVLTNELKVNYMENNTGIFRVELRQNRFYYNEFGHVLEADCLDELKQQVLQEGRIWYVFDEDLLRDVKALR